MNKINEANIGANELIFHTDNEKIYSGGFDVTSVMMKL